MRAAKKGLCLVLAILLCVGLFVACGGNEPGAGTEEPVELTPDTVVVEMDGRPVLWEEMYFDLQSIRSRIEFMGPVEDWDAVFEGQTLYEGEVSYNEFVILYAIDMARERRAVEILFEELGESLPEDFYEDLRQGIMEREGLDEVAFHDLLEENFLTERVFASINMAAAMYEEVQRAFSTQAVSQAEIEAFVEEAGILRAKHILISTRDMHQQELSEEEQEAATAKALALYEELQTLSGEELLERFDEMIALYGEDPGMVGNPTGYTFEPGVMVAEFTEGTLDLEFYEVGPPVRSFFGYHIILRLPVEASATVMTIAGPGQTVQAMVAMGQVEEALERIRAEIEYERTPFLMELVPGELFAQTSEDEDEEDGE